VRRGLPETTSDECRPIVLPTGIATPRTADDAPMGTAPSSRPGWLAGALLAVLFVTLAAWSWDKWADPIVDFGNEPYLAWQLLHGRAMHRDLASLYGPLSPWINALWFSLFGPSLRTLALCNLALTAVLVIVVHRFCAAREDERTAGVATTVLLTSFVFAHHAEDAPNYNFIWPYSHAATHGSILLACGVLALGRAVLSDRTGWWALAGFLLSPILLVKPEIATAAAVAVTTGLVWRATDGRPRWHRGVCILVAAGAVPLAVCVLVLGAEPLVVPLELTARLAASPDVYFKRLMGIDDVAGNALRLVTSAVVWSAVGAAVVLADLRSVRLTATGRRWLTLGAAAVSAFLVVRDLPGVGRPLPILIPIALGALVVVVRRRPTERTRLVPLAIWGAAAWTLLSRMALNVQLHHYGFYLAMPAAIFVVVFGVGTVPRLLATRVPGGGDVVRTVSLATIGLLLACSVGLSIGSYGHMTVALGADGDALLAPAPDVSPSGALASALSERIAERVPPDATLAVLPQGALLNFLTRRSNPTAFHDLAPPVFEAYGDAILAAYVAHAPQYVVLVDAPGDEYGVGRFGRSTWGHDLVAWVESRYDRIETVPPTRDRPGFAIWRSGVD
jgi:hypothetical protein